MRFKKGTIVEVLSDREVPSGAWSIAEIISGNGHYYTVRYESYADEERVPRKIIRPLPPPVEVVGCWARGDIAEVFENSSWKMAVVSKILERGCFLVRLLGSSLELRANQFDIRVRQSWQNDKWIVIGQASKGGNEVQRSQTSSVKCKARLSSRSHVRNLRKKLNPEGDIISLERKDNLDVFSFLPSKVLKRQSYCLVEPHGRTTQKIRAVEKDGRLNRPFTACPTKLIEQGDDILFRGETVHGKHNIGSAEYRTGSFLDADTEKRKDSGTSECLLEKDIEEEEERDSVASSVGSCSIGTDVFDRVEDIEEITSTDAESICDWGSPRKMICSAGEVHRLDLDEYRCALERLHATGPITWEEEEWITDLRLTLNISNDEHLMQIRNLVSAGNAI